LFYLFRSRQLLGLLTLWRFLRRSGLGTLLRLSHLRFGRRGRYLHDSPEYLDFFQIDLRRANGIPSR
jgi:hypothetical protein